MQRGEKTEASSPAAGRRHRFGSHAAFAATLGVAALVLLGALLATAARTPGTAGPVHHADAARASTARESVSREGKDAARSYAPIDRTASLTQGVPVDPGTFAPGACVAFPPTSGDNHHTVFIDAGHGGIDPGGEGVTEAGTAIYEDAENLPIALEVSNLLRAKGFRTVLSRVTSTNVARLTPQDTTDGVLSPTGAVADVAARDLCADDAGAAVLLGIYMDAGTSPSNAGCLTAWDPDRPFAAKSDRLATLVQADVLGSMNAHGWQIPNDGVATDTTLGGLPLTTTAASYDHLLLLGPGVTGWFTTPSEMPGALVEPLYLTDPYEGSIANSAAGHQAIAGGMAQAIEQYFAR